MATRNFTFKFRRDTAANWAAKNPILGDGEPGVETDTNSMKLGDGMTAWLNLDYFIDKSDTTALIDQALSDYDPGGGGGGVSQGEFDDHVNSEDPHLVYDDGTSFLLRYENAKV